MSRFYIWDSRERDGNALFWREQAAGYTTNLDEAGIYTTEEVSKRRLEWHQVAIPVEEVDPKAHRAIRLTRMREAPTEPEAVRKWREEYRAKMQAEEAAFSLEAQGGRKL